MADLAVDTDPNDMLAGLAVYALLQSPAAADELLASLSGSIVHSVRRIYTASCVALSTFVTGDHAWKSDSVLARHAVLMLANALLAS